MHWRQRRKKIVTKKWHYFVPICVTLYANIFTCGCTARTLNAWNGIRFAYPSGFWLCVRDTICMCELREWVWVVCVFARVYRSKIHTVPLHMQAKFNFNSIHTACTLLHVLAVARARSNTFSATYLHSMRWTRFSLLSQKKSVTSLLVLRKNRISVHVCFLSFPATNRMRRKNNKRIRTRIQRIECSERVCRWDFVSFVPNSNAIKSDFHLLEIASFIYSMHISQFLPINGDTESRNETRHLLGVQQHCSLKSHNKIESCWGRRLSTHSKLPRFITHWSRAPLIIMDSARLHYSLMCWCTPAYRMDFAHRTWRIFVRFKFNGRSNSRNENLNEILSEPSRK